MNKKTLLKLGILLVFAAVFAAAYPYIKEYASLDFLKSKQAVFKEYYQANKAVVLGGYFALYIAVVALSLPGAAFMTLLAGALFGLVAGVVVVSFASTIGATLAFLFARFVIGASLQEKYGDKLVKLNDGIEREGAFYLFTLRLIPAFPFFLINLLMALTKIPVWTFYWVSQAGALAGTVVYVYAGTALADINALEEILSAEIIAAFVALGLLPLVSKKIIAFIRAKRAKPNARPSPPSQP